LISEDLEFSHSLNQNETLKPRIFQDVSSNFADFWAQTLTKRSNFEKYRLISLTIFQNKPIYWPFSVIFGGKNFCKNQRASNYLFNIHICEAKIRFTNITALLKNPKEDVELRELHIRGSAK